jgi:hypothetical protein
MKQLSLFALLCILGYLIYIAGGVHAQSELYAKSKHIQMQDSILKRCDRCYHNNTAMLKYYERKQSMAPHNATANKKK